MRYCLLEGERYVEIEILISLCSGFEVKGNQVRVGITCGSRK